MCKGSSAGFRCGNGQNVSLVVRFHEANGLDRHLVEDLVDVARLLARLCPTLERMQLRRPSPAELARLGVPSAA